MRFNSDNGAQYVSKDFAVSGTRGLRTAPYSGTSRSSSCQLNHQYAICARPLAIAQNAGCAHSGIPHRLNGAMASSTDRSSPDYWVIWPDRGLRYNAAWPPVHGLPR